MTNTKSKAKGATKRTKRSTGSQQRVVRARWDFDPKTGEPREWLLIAKKDIEGQQWTFPKGKRLRGFKDLRDGDWCVYVRGDYYSSRIFGVPQYLLKPLRRAKAL